MSHAPDFIVTHSISYVARELDCGSCHESTDYCIDCHTLTNIVIPIDHTSPGWSGHEHAEEARVNFERCVVCHRDGEARCVKCHG